MKQLWARIFLPALLMTAGAGVTAAQDETDALRYSLLQPQGTARSIGIGGAVGAIGGDFTSLSINPAGIGIYRKSEFMITPSLMLNRVNSTMGNDASYLNNGSHFSISNIGIVWTRAEQGRRYERSKWKTVSFGMGLNRLADFTRNFSYQGDNNTSSGSEVFSEDANNFNFVPNSNDQSSPAYLGYESYLIDRFTNGYGTNVNYAAGLRQFNSVKERGGISELAFSLGGNYMERLMLGGTLGVPILKYKRNKTYEERDISGIANNGFDKFVYNEDLGTSGLGINLKLGAIYKVNDYLRFGAAFHTPTAYALTDIMDADLTSNTENLKADTFSDFSGPITEVTAQQRQYSYSLTTPWRLVLSAAALFGKFGFFTLDYEYVDYSRTHFKFSDNQEDQNYQQVVNGMIKDSYRGASNIRTGLEIRLDNLSLRGGFGYYGNPFQSDVYADGQRLDFSAGVGYRHEQMFFDLGFVHHHYTSTDAPYQLNRIAVPIASQVTGQNNAALTVGWKF